MGVIVLAVPINLDPILSMHNFCLLISLELFNGFQLYSYFHNCIQ